jgi:hypothetical protein
MRTGRVLAFGLVAVLLLPLAAALRGARGPREVHLNCGPGDGPYTSGFTSPRPESFDPYEIQDQVATHWTTHDARIELPLTVDAPAAGVALRFARHLADRGHLEVRLGGQPAARFEILKGYQDYETTRALSGPTPLVLDLHTDAQDDRGLGVSLDWVRLDLPRASQLRLRGAARFRPTLALSLLLLLLIAGGVAPAWAVGASSVPSLLSAFGLLRDPWLVHRLTTGVPEALFLLLPIVFLLRRALVREGRVALPHFRLALVLFLAVALPRALLVNHPDYYYPDLMIHARLAKLMHRAGPESILRPDLFLGRFQEARHSFSGMPYSLAFHLPLAVLDPAYDHTMTALKVGGAFLSTLPVPLGVLLIRRTGLSLFGAGLLAVAPSYPHWLFQATLPALLGHAVDLGLLLWLIGHLEGLDRPRTFLMGALLVAAAQLAYAFGLPVTGLLVLFLALFTAWPGGRALPGAVRLLAMGALGAALGFALYYRHFVDGVLAVAAGVGSPGAFPEGAAPSALDRVAATLAEASRFFDTLWPLLALPGLVLLLRPRPGVAVFRAWTATVLVLMALRIALPGVFRWNHWVLLLTPLLCLLAGETLGWLGARAGGGRLAAGLLWAGISAASLLVTARSFLAQLDNAR